MGRVIPTPSDAQARPSLARTPRASCGQTRKERDHQLSVPRPRRGRAESLSAMATVGGNEGARPREITRPSNLIGDTTWCRGDVVGTDAGTSTVTLQLRATNQRD